MPPKKTKTASNLLFADVFMKLLLGQGKESPNVMSWFEPCLK